MGWHKQHKENSKDKVLNSAAALFTRHGFEKVSIDQVMKNAQLTRGAFYAHFKSKSDLYAQAIVKAARSAQKEQRLQCNSTLLDISQSYLSQAHRDEKLNIPCPLAALVTDINQQNETVKDTYTSIFKAFINQTQPYTHNRNKALQSAALMIGGLALARALSDKTLSDDLLIACQEGIAELVREDV